MSATNSHRRAEPMISWDHDFDTNAFYAKLRIPQKWHMEVSHSKRRLQLWWWLTKLVWSMPK